MLTILNDIPPALYDVEVSRLWEVLPESTLIHLSGRKKEPLFVSVLLHGNEETGLLAIQSLLRDFQTRELPRALSIFIGNVKAARFHMRRLDGQPDFNRIWLDGNTPEHQMMAKVIDEMRRRNVFASIDIHNNTGINPHYACINRLENSYLQLATLFSRTVVYFIRPEGVQSSAFANLCPSVTLECGLPAQQFGVDHARSYLEACLNLVNIPMHAVASSDIDLFHTVAIVKVPASATLSFGQGTGDFQFIADLDQLNFSELPANTRFGKMTDSSNFRLEVSGEHGENLGRRYFQYRDNEMRTAMPFMPSMLTLDERVIRQDCLCYIMERLDPKTFQPRH
ncbi:MAG: M14 family metallopeptidase [Gammaproteobacteria bacterium]